METADLATLLPAEPTLDEAGSEEALSKSSYSPPYPS